MFIAFFSIDLLKLATKPIPPSVQKSRERDPAALFLHASHDPAGYAQDGQRDDQPDKHG